MVRSVVAVLLCAAGTGGCAVHPPNWRERPNWTRLGNTSKANDTDVAFYRDPHHQYYDKQHRRYYYFDPTEKKFFWENGVPKS